MTAVLLSAEGVTLAAYMYTVPGVGEGDLALAKYVS